MKKIGTFLLLALLWGYPLLAQSRPDAPAASKKDTNRRTITVILRYLSKNFRDRDTVEISLNPARHRIPRVDQEWVLDVGTNNYLQGGQFPASDGKRYGLRNSLDYVALSTLAKVHIGGDRSPLFFNTGLEMSWNALRFKEDVQVFQDTQGVGLRPVLDAAGVPQALKKSKLGIAYLSIPATFSLDFKQAGLGNFRMSLGGYVGLRIRSWSKVKLNSNDRVKRIDSFYLNDIRYGLMGEIGYNFVRLFVKYDLNPLFRQGRSFDPNSDLNVINIGLRF